ncbi:MAG: CRTAC1 family protein [Planctomycetaceae bacterium]|nr:CRTAC1 family protein [Planctomycetaceae bacterium]
MVSKSVFFRQIGHLVAALVIFSCHGCAEDKPPIEKPDRTSAAPQPGPKIQFDAILNEKPLAHPPKFVEVARELGVSFKYFNDAREKRYFFPEILGGGFAALDFDLDGWPDLFCTNGRALPLDLPDNEHVDCLLQNRNGTQLQDVTASARIRESGFGHGCAFGDLNADGFDDLAVACYMSISLWINQGDGTFLNVPVENYPYEPTWSVCPVICDLNNDRISDLLVVNYVKWNYEVPACTYNNIRGYCGPGEFDGVRDYVFMNQGDGFFVEQGLELGFTSIGKGLAVASLDWDHDLRPEIYIANDLLANFFYRVDPNDTNRFFDDGSNAGVAFCVNGNKEASMSVTPGDFAVNGWTDIFVTNYYKQKNTLYSNSGRAKFRDVSFAAGTHKTGEMFLGFGAVAVDFDKDGWLDLFVGNGHVLGPEHLPNQLTNQILRNESGVFDDVSKQGGDFFNVPTLSRGVVAFDLDQDLDSDVVVNHLDRPISILRNDSVSPNQSIGFQVMSPKHDPLEGCRIEMTHEGKTQTFPVYSGGSYLTDAPKEWIIGLGTAKSVDQVRVYWRDGQVDSWDNLETGIRWQFQPGRKRRV